MWIIGDIHGCLRELESLLMKIPDKDRILFLGDYIDRGPDSFGVVETMLSLKDRGVFLKGNHEDMLLSYYLDPESQVAQAWKVEVNGAPTTLASYRMKYSDPIGTYPPLHRKFFEELNYYYNGPDFLAVHAGFRPGLSLADQTRTDMLWIRNEWLKNEATWSDKQVFYGHSPARYVLGMDRENEIIIGQKSIGLDTGCVYGGSLSAYNSLTGELIQVKARNSYI